jgi:RNA polymerase sigma-70 factor (ECF subfamily)
MSFTDQDEALISAALDGSARAWERLVKRYESRVYNFSLRLTGNPTDALDLMQEVFLGVYRNLPRFRGDSQFTTWLFRIAHNKAVDMSRRKYMVTSLSSLAGQEQSEDDVLDHIASDERDQDPQSLIGESQNNAEILRSLEVLNLEQRLVIELKVFQSYTFDEIALMQDISANTAKTRFYTALRILKAHMEQQHELS